MLSEGNSHHSLRAQNASEPVRQLLTPVFSILRPLVNHSLPSLFRMVWWQVVDLSTESSICASSRAAGTGQDTGDEKGERERNEEFAEMFLLVKILQREAEEL